MRKPAFLFFLLGLALVLLLAPRGHYLENQPFSGQARVGGAFMLTDTQGHTLKDSDFRGKFMLVYMGYTHCPDICPATLDTMSEALRLLGPDAGKVAAIFITLDPGRDTPQVLGKYLKSFDPRILGLTGSDQAIAEVVRAYKAFSSKAPLPGGQDYLVNHSGFLYLMDRQGKYITHFDAGVKPEAIMQAVRSQP